MRPIDTKASLFRPRQFWTDGLRRGANYLAAFIKDVGRSYRGIEFASLIQGMTGLFLAITLQFSFFPGSIDRLFPVDLNSKAVHFHSKATMKSFPSLFILSLFEIFASYGAPVSAAELSRAQVIALSNDKTHKLNLKKKDLSGLDLSGLDLRGADLFSANLDGSKLDGAKLNGATLDRAQMRKASLVKADLSAASLYAVVLDHADLTEAKLVDSRIIGLLNHVNLTRAQLTGADLGADMANQGMAPARTEMSNAVLSGADLSNANLRHAIMPNANLQNSNLHKAQLQWADLSGADFTHAGITGADFSNAVLEGAKLSKAAGRDSALGLKTGGSP